jgi:hypothetical protein
MHDNGDWFMTEEGTLFSFTPVLVDNSRQAAELLCCGGKRLSQRLACWQGTVQWISALLHGH